MLYEVITHPLREQVAVGTAEQHVSGGHVPGRRRAVDEGNERIAGQVQQPDLPGDRITSYNVCYTKLLRC